MNLPQQTKIAIKFWPFWLPVVTVLLALFVRAARIDHFYSSAMVTDGLYGQLVVKHDGLVIGIFMLLHASGWMTPFRTLSTLLRLAAWFVMAFYVGDLFVFVQFTERLSLTNFVTFVGETNAIIDVVSGFVRDPKNVLVTALLTLTCASLLATVIAPPTRYKIRQPIAARAPIASILFGAMLIGYSFWPDQRIYNNDWAYRNVIEIAAMEGVRAPYSAEMTDAARIWSEQADNARQCVTGLNSGRNVIVVIMESLSTHHSRYLSGLSDWTPRIDEIARDNHVWTDFFANGTNTSYGLVAVLTGHDPLTAMNVREYNRFMGIHDALPFRLKASGYTSAFLTSGDLGFVGTGKWLKSIGFDFIEDIEAPYYKGAERFNFGAVSDATLYDRTRQWIQVANEKKAPFFLVVNTLSSHQPYLNPVTREKSEAAAFHYADEAFASYVKALKVQGFFAKGGVLFLTGDHHAMVMVGQDEISRFGKSASARVPLIVIGENLNLPKQISNAFQQADLPASIEYLTAKRACFTNRQRNLFQPNSEGAARCILFMRGDQHDTVDAFCGAKYGQIRLDGDATKLSKGDVPDANGLLREVNAERIGWFLRKDKDVLPVRSLPNTQMVQ